MDLSVVKVVYIFCRCCKDIHKVEDIAIDDWKAKHHEESRCANIHHSSALPEPPERSKFTGKSTEPPTQPIFKVPNPVSIKQRSTSGYKVPQALNLSIRKTSCDNRTKQDVNGSQISQKQIIQTNDLETASTSSSCPKIVINPEGSKRKSKASATSYAKKVKNDLPYTEKSQLLDVQRYANSTVIKAGVGTSMWPQGYETNLHSSTPKNTMLCHENQSSQELPIRGEASPSNNAGSGLYSKKSKQSATTKKKSSTKTTKDEVAAGNSATTVNILEINISQDTQSSHDTTSLSIPNIVRENKASATSYTNKLTPILPLPRVLQFLEAQRDATSKVINAGMGKGICPQGYERNKNSSVAKTTMLCHENQSSHDLAIRAEGSPCNNAGSGVYSKKSKQSAKTKKKSSTKTTKDKVAAGNSTTTVNISERNISQSSHESLRFRFPNIVRHLTESKTSATSYTNKLKPKISQSLDVQRDANSTVINAGVGTCIWPQGYETNKLSSVAKTTMICHENQLSHDLPIRGDGSPTNNAGSGLYSKKSKQSEKTKKKSSTKTTKDKVAAGNSTTTVNISERNISQSSHESLRFRFPNIVRHLTESKTSATSYTNKLKPKISQSLDVQRDANSTVINAGVGTCIWPQGYETNKLSSVAKTTMICHENQLSHDLPIRGDGSPTNNAGSGLYSKKSKQSAKTKKKSSTKTTKDKVAAGNSTTTVNISERNISQSSHESLRSRFPNIVRLLTECKTSATSYTNKLKPKISQSLDGQRDANSTVINAGVSTSIWPQGYETNQNSSVSKTTMLCHENQSSHDLAIRAEGSPCNNAGSGLYNKKSKHSATTKKKSSTKTTKDKVAAGNSTTTVNISEINKYQSSHDTTSLSCSNIVRENKASATSYTNKLKPSLRVPHPKTSQFLDVQRDTYSTVINAGVGTSLWAQGYETNKHSSVSKTTMLCHENQSSHELPIHGDGSPTNNAGSGLYSKKGRKSASTKNRSSTKKTKDEVAPGNSTTTVNISERNISSMNVLQSIPHAQLVGFQATGIPIIEFPVSTVSEVNEVTRQISVESDQHMISTTNPADPENS